MADDGRAVVLGGGGVTGVAWEIGLLHGLAELGVDLSQADLFVGTSAGSVVAAQITEGTPLDELFARELADTSGDRNAAIGSGVLLRFVFSALLPGDRRRGRAWLGRAALRAKTVPESERRNAIRSRVPNDEWPATALRIPAVNAQTGEVVVFDKDSGVSLIDAVAASCAVPLVWPPMTVNGARYVDGGVRSIANADLAGGYRRVVVIAPVTTHSAPRGSAGGAGGIPGCGRPYRRGVAQRGRTDRDRPQSAEPRPPRRRRRGGPEAGGRGRGTRPEGLGLAHADTRVPCCPARPSGLLILHGHHLPRLRWAAAIVAARPAARAVPDI